MELDIADEDQIEEISDTYDNLCDFLNGTPMNIVACAIMVLLIKIHKRANLPLDDLLETMALQWEATPPPVWEENPPPEM